MKPGFALSLSVEGISLLVRSDAGWRRVGDVHLDVDDLGAAMAGLHQDASELAPGGVHSKIVLPNEQIRYLTIDTGDADTAGRRKAAALALDGATPYAVDDLVYDIAADGPLTHVAAVARETLNEAEAFAIEHRFDPVSFVAIPGDQIFDGEPFFGRTRHSETILPPGESVEPDPTAIVIIESGATPDDAVAPKATVGADIAPEVEPVQDPVPSIPAPSIPAPSIPAPSIPAPSGTAAPAEHAAPATDARPHRVVTHEPAPEPPGIGKGVVAEGVTTPEVSPEGTGADPVAAPTGFASRRAEVARPAAPAAAGQSRSAAQPAPLPEHRQTPPRPARPAPTVSAAQTPTPTRAFTSVRTAVAPSASAPRPASAGAPGSSLRATASAAPSEEPPRNGFMSRRHTKAAAKPVKPQPDPHPSDAEQMTVFGARSKAAPNRGKPRFLGLTLTVILLVVLAGVAAFASIFTDNRISRLFSREPEAAAIRPVQDPAETPGSAVDPRILAMPAETVGGPEPSDSGETDAPLDASEPDADDDYGAEPDAPPADTADLLSETDAAVLDALRDPGDDADNAQDGDVDPEMLADAPLPEDAPEGADTAPSTPAAEAASYAATGIWSSAPARPGSPGVISLDDLFVAAIDGATLTQDAIALPTAASYGTDVSPNGVTSPAAPGTAFELDALGLVEPAPDGTVTPDGILVYLGQPPRVPPPTPERVEIADPTEEPLEPVLPATRPRDRPDDLVENAERAQLGGLTLSELSGVRPLSRPYEPEPPEPPEEEDTPVVEEAPLSAAELRLASLKPKARPRGFERTVAAAQAPRATASAGPAAAASTAVASTAATATRDRPLSSSRNAPAVPRSEAARPTGNTPSSVAKQATIKNAINLRQVNLIGVYGTPSNRRALVRLSSGRYQKVKVGDRIDGGQVVAIGDSELRYQKGGRNVVLRMPSG